MENIPSDISKDQLIKIQIDNDVYYIHPRSFGQRTANQAKHSLSPITIMANMLGLGFFANLDQSTQSFYYVTKDTPSGDPMKTTVDSTNLKIYIKLFAFEKGLKLDKAVFSVTSLSGFGKKRKVVNVSLRSVMADIKYLQLI
jgi:hypothetical protein